jgi:hypothetical protein
VRVPIAASLGVMQSILATVLPQKVSHFFKKAMAAEGEDPAEGEVGPLTGPCRFKLGLTPSTPAALQVSEEPEEEGEEVGFSTVLCVFTRPEPPINHLITGICRVVRRVGRRAKALALAPLETKRRTMMM